MGGVEYQVTKVDPTDPETKGMVYQVHKVSEEVAATLGGKVYRARIIKDPSDPTVAGKVYQIVLIADPDDPSVKGKVYNAILTGDSEVVVVGPAVSPLALDDAVADSLTYVKAFGGTEQRNIPQPYTQVNYVTNTAQTAVNTGIMIDFAKNYEFEVECRAVSGSWYILQSRASSTGNITGIHGATSGSTITLVVGNVTVCTSAITRTVGNKLYVKATLNAGTATLYVKDETANTEDTQTGSYGTSQPNPTAAVYLLGNAGGQYVDVNSDIYMARIKENDTVVMDYVPARQVATAGFYDKASGTFKTALIPANLSADGNTVPTPDAPMDIISNNGALRASINEFDANAITNGYFYNADLEWVANSAVYTTDYMKTVKDKYTLVLSNVSTVSSTVNVRVNLFNANKEIQSQLVIPIMPDTTEYTYEVDIPDGISYVRVSTNPMYVVVSGFSNSKTIYTDGTVETIEDTIGNTATAEMLLKVGNYQDVQSIIDGVVTRNVGVLVLDGTENNWQHTGIFYFNTMSDISPTADYIICTHASYGTDPRITNKIGYRAAKNGIWITRSDLSSVDEFKQYLAEQYANGTPVVVYYPLATPTTESVAGQALQVTDGDNVLEITQASLTGLELEAEYEKEGA